MCQQAIASQTANYLQLLGTWELSILPRCHRIACFDISLGFPMPCQVISIRQFATFPRLTRPQSRGSQNQNSWRVLLRITRNITQHPFASQVALLLRHHCNLESLLSSPLLSLILFLF